MSLTRISPKRKTTYLGGRTFRLVDLRWWILCFHIERKHPGGWWL